MKTIGKSEIEEILENVVNVINANPKNEMEKYHKERLEELKDEFVTSYKKIERDYRRDFQIISQPCSPTWEDELL